MTTMPPWLLRQLQDLRRQQGHALLLSGPAGMGQYDLAMGLAQAWLCEQPTEQGACGVCASCHAIEVKTHPDLKMLLPETLCLEWGWPIDPKTQEKIDKKEVKPSKWIRVDAAREAVSFTQLTQSRGRGQVVLIYPAERLNVESANTLLKTLEEPTGQTRFIVATEAAHQLLPTIRSRCLTHTMQWPQEAEALAWLALHTQASAADIACALKATGGLPSEALEWLLNGFVAAAWAALPKSLWTQQPGPLADWPIARQMDALQKLCHDLLCLANQAQPRYFDPAHLPTRLPSLAALVSWQKDLQKAAQTMEHPYMPALLQEAWVLRAAQALHNS